MKTITPFKLLLLLFAISFSNVHAQSFVHPGILHTQADFNRMAQKVNANEQPWKGSYDLLVASAEAQLSWNPRATATVIRGGTGDNVALLYRDVQAAYQHALIYKITGNTAHGNKARDILNAWSATHTTLTGNADRYLASGLFGYQFANAAEMMRGYSGFDVPRFQNYLLNVYYYPLVERFLVGNSHGSDHNDACITNYWANWDLANMAAMVAIGVFCDNRAIYNQGIEYFKNGAGNSRGGGNGVITKAIPFVHSSTMAQWQESGRDQGHTILGIGLMASFCEIAWNQGDDMYAYDDYRFRKAANYVAAYNNGQNVPYTLYSWGSGQNCAYNEQPGISPAGRGEVRPIWEMIYNHYANRVGQASLIPWVAQEAADLRPEGGPGGHATTYDQPGFGSLTHYEGSGSGGGIPQGYTLCSNEGQNCTFSGTVNVAYGANGQFNYQYNVTGGSIACDNATFGDPINGVVKACYVQPVSGGSTYYQLRNRGTGLVLDGMGRTSNGDACGQYANTTNHVNSHWERIATGSYYYFKNRGTGLLLDGMGRTTNGADVGQWANTTSNNAQWSVQQYSGNYYRIQNRATGLYLDGMGNTANGDACGQYANTSHVNAQWELVPISGGQSQSTESRKMSLVTPEDSDMAEIYIHPNPVSTVLYLDLPTASPEGVVEILDMNGKRMDKVELTEKRSEIDVSALKPGMYVLRIANKEGYWSRKFVKVKE